jgi:hypothetical protein
MIRSLSLFWLLAWLGGWSVMAEPLSVAGLPAQFSLGQASFQELEALPMSTYDAHTLILLIGAAQQMVRDTGVDTQDRGYVCFNLVADELQRRSQEKGFEVEDPAVVFLLAQLAQEQYHLALTRPSDWAKLWHYVQEGRWQYVAQRFVDRGMHLPAGLLLLLGGMMAFFVSRRRRTHQGDN